MVCDSVKNEFCLGGLKRLEGAGVMYEKMSRWYRSIPNHLYQLFSLRNSSSFFSVAFFLLPDISNSTPLVYSYCFYFRLSRPSRPHVICKAYVTRKVGYVRSSPTRNRKWHARLNHEFMYFTIGYSASYLQLMWCVRVTYKTCER